MHARRFILIIQNKSEEKFCLLRIRVSLSDFCEDVLLSTGSVSG